MQSVKDYVKGWEITHNANPHGWFVIHEIAVWSAV